jgi:hypothetical protein
VVEFMGYTCEYTKQFCKIQKKNEVDKGNEKKGMKRKVRIIKKKWM